MLTVEDIWRSALPSGTTLIAGSAGLSRKVTWASRMMPRAPGFRALKGGEIALVSTQTMRQLDELVTLSELVRRLSDREVAAVVLLGDATPEAMSLADRLEMPILRLPANADVPEVEQEITRFIVDSRTELFQRSQSIFLQLTELAMQGGGPASLLQRVASLTGKAVALEDQNARLEHFARGRLPLDEEAARTLLAAQRAAIMDWTSCLRLGPGDPPCAQFAFPESGLTRLVAPMVFRDRVWGFISLLGRSQEISESDQLTLARAASACSIGLARDRAVLEAQEQLQSSFLEDLLAGTLTDPRIIHDRARRLGYSLRPPYACLAAEITPKGKRAQGSVAVRQSALQPEIEKLGNDCLYRLVGGSLMLLVPIDEEEPRLDVKQMAEAIRARLLARLADVSIAVGVGRVHAGLEGIGPGCQEARQSLGIGLKLFGLTSLTYFGDLGTYRLLLNLEGTGTLEEFYQETLGPLLDYDRRSGSELVPTLSTYFECSQSMTRAAEQLNVHRNSLLYRLQRVEEISGLDLEDPEARLSLQLALRIGDILNATGRA